MLEFNTDSLQITPKILSLNSEIDQFKGAWKVKVKTAIGRLSDWKRHATIESIGSSTRIEGSQMTNQDVEELLTELKIKKFATRDEQEVAGYAKVIDTVLESWADIPITENHIKQLHRDLLQHSVKDERHRGEYKTHPNHVAAFDSKGNQVGVIFKTSTPFDTPRRMSDLVLWYENSLKQVDTHPLITIAVFKLVFLAIHPFQDGNGRLSRILVVLMLLKAGYDYASYSSFESVIEGTKADYYRSLRGSQLTLETENPNWQPWLEYFFLTLNRQKRRLEDKIDFEKLVKEFGLSELANAIFYYANENSTVTNRGLVRVTGTNSNTMKAVLRKLESKGFLKRRGAGRSTEYELIKEKIYGREK